MIFRWQMCGKIEPIWRVERQRGEREMFNPEQKFFAFFPIRAYKWLNFTFGMCSGEIGISNGYMSIMFRNLNLIATWFMFQSHIHNDTHTHAFCFRMDRPHAKCVNLELTLPFFENAIQRKITHETPSQEQNMRIWVMNARKKNNSIIKLITVQYRRAQKYEPMRRASNAKVRCLCKF